MANPNAIRLVNSGIALDRRVKYLHNTNPTRSFDEPPKYTETEIWVKRVSEIDELGGSTGVAAIGEITYITRYRPLHTILLTLDFVLDQEVFYNIQTSTSLGRRNYITMETLRTNFPDDAIITNGN